MKITKRQLRRIIKEALDPATQKVFDDARKYRTKGEWRLRVSGAGETYLKPGWMAGKEVEDFFGNYDEAKIFDNELSAEVDRDLIKKDPANATAGELEVEGGTPSKMDQIDPRPAGQTLESVTKRQLRRIIKEELLCEGSEIMNSFKSVIALYDKARDELKLPVEELEKLENDMQSFWENTVNSWQADREDIPLKDQPHAPWSDLDIRQVDADWKSNK